MVKLSCVVILKYNGPDKDPYILGLEADLSSFGYFQRSTVKEMMTFVSRTVARKTQVGQRQTVQQEEYFCHAFNKDGLVGIAFVDQDYPARAGFCVVNKILEDFQLQQGEAWRGVTVDNPELAQTLLTDALVKFQVRLYTILCQNIIVLFTILPTDVSFYLLISLGYFFICRTLHKRISSLRSRETWMRLRLSFIRLLKVC